MRRADRISSFFWIILSFGLMKWGLDLELGTLAAPDAGFIIFGVGVVMLALALAILMKTLFTETELTHVKKLWPGFGWRKVALLLVALSVYGFLLLSLGFVLDTFLLMFFLLKWIEPHKWLTAIGTSAAMASVTYLVFAYWLGCQLPKGVLDFF
jgi:putative tricarboxylic transport membrane protein